MARGDGRIYLRDTTYWCAYYLRGKEHRESTGKDDPKKAENFLKARLREVGADLIGARTFTTVNWIRLLEVKQELDHFLEEHKNELKMKPQTQSAGS